MHDGRLFTIRDIARELGLPESTVRYYRDAFEEYLPTVGTGRRRRYPTETIPLLRLIAEGFAHNRARSEIERTVNEVPRSDTGVTLATSPVRASLDVETPRNELLATVLDGERERREVMWQMARELVRLGEAIERQQMLLASLVERVAAASRALPAGDEGWSEADAAGAAGAASAAPDPAEELDALRRELAHERELVERLRRSKLDIERRAAEAEAKLGEGGESPGRGGLLGRLRPRDTHQTT
jgi:DNA-binding transcriptional MerR regulator